MPVKVPVKVPVAVAVEVPVEVPVEAPVQQDTRTARIVAFERYVAGCRQAAGPDTSPAARRPLPSYDNTPGTLIA